MQWDGGIQVVVTVAQGSVAAVTVASHRRVDACKVLVGRTVEQAVATVPLLYSICAQAQGLAAHLACEAALGREADAERYRVQQIAVAAEALESHALQVATVWLPLVGLPPAVTPLRRLMAAAAQARHGIAGGVVEAVEALCGPEPPLGATRFDAWLLGHAPAQQVLARMPQPNLGRCVCPCLPPLPGAWFADALALNPELARFPVWEGLPAETGALAVHAQHPTVAAMLEAHGNGVMTRWVARLVAMRALAEQLDGTKVLRTAEGSPIPMRGNRRGAAVVDTARGQLAHVVDVRDGVVTKYQVVAPTEWNFHPDGPLVRGLLGTAAQDLQCMHDDVAWVVAGLDPCVAVETRVLEA